MKGKGTILYIENEPKILALYQERLTDAGYVLLTAYNGKKGLALARSKRPDLIFIAAKLPDVDVLVLLKKLKTDPKTKTIPVVISSDAYDSHFENKCLHSGAEEYFLKTEAMSADMVGVMKVYLTKAQEKQGKKM